MLKFVHSIYFFQLQVLEEHLREFGIDDLSSVNIVSDRGSNFVAAFRDFDSLFCFGHRMTNIVKVTFFQNVKRKKQTLNSLKANDTSSIALTTAMPQRNIVLNIHDDLSSEGTSEDEEVNILPTIPVLRKKRKMKTKSTNNQQQLQSKVSIDDIPLAARSVLGALTNCKKMVKYIKKVCVV